MTLEFIAAQIFGVITAKTAPIVVDFLSNQMSKILRTRIGKGKREVEELRKEVEDLRKRLESQPEVEATDIRKLEVNIEKILLVQKEYGLELLSDEAHRKWVLSQFDRLGQIRQLEDTFKIDVWIEAGTLSSPRDISVVPKVSEGRYTIGDKITLFFRSERDCYLHLFNLGTSGKITVLFPNLLFQDNFIKANRVYSIPGKGYPFEYELRGPKGIERIRGIATTEKVDLMDLDFYGKEGIFHSAERSAAARDIQIIEKHVKELPLTSWAEALCEFTVE